MKPVRNWRAVLRHAWSVRFLAVAALLSGVEAALPYLDEVLPIPRGAFGLASCFVTVAAFIARFVAQPTISGDER